jgi:Protein of unknown function (DUF1194)
LFGGGTSISGAIDYSRVLLAAGPFFGIRRVIDISGDGANNRGRAATLARDEAVGDGISINGLPILSVEPNLDRYYYNNVIGRPGAFMVPARNYDTFADAILKKLITEIAGAAPIMQRPSSIALSVSAVKSRHLLCRLALAIRANAGRYSLLRGFCRANCRPGRSDECHSASTVYLLCCDCALSSSAVRFSPSLGPPQFGGPFFRGRHGVNLAIWRAAQPLHL